MHREERIIKIRKNNAVSLFAILVDNLTSPPELICGHTNLFDNEINGNKMDSISIRCKYEYDLPTCLILQLIQELDLEFH